MEILGTDKEEDVEKAITWVGHASALKASEK
jgi:hypothetical protein